MKRHILSLFLFSVLIQLISCTNQNTDISKSAPEEVSDNNSVNNESEEKISLKVGLWAEKGVECYGIVIANFSDGKTRGKSVKCKITALKPDKIKVKTLESISLIESEGCDKMGVAFGETWWETEGDLFQTREEADKYLSDKGWLIK